MFLTSISTNDESEPALTDCVISLLTKGSGLTNRRKLGLVKSGEGALSSFNSYMTIFVLAVTTGAKQVRLVLLTIVQGDWEEKRTTVKRRMVRGKEELTAPPLKMS